MDPWVALTLAATRTERVQLAACVTNFQTRHPAITAGAAASVDAVSGGRLILGVGAGHSGVANVGASASPPVDFRDGLRFTRALLAGERASLAGKEMQLPRHWAGACRSMRRHRARVRFARRAPSLTAPS